MDKRFVAAMLVSAGMLGSFISCAAIQERSQTRDEAKITTAPPPGTPADVAPIVWETKPQHDARMKWWREARFGMFIHWGLYCVAGGVWNGEPAKGAGEWIENNLKIPVASYAAMAKRFDPIKFNAEQWVLAAKNAGMQYMVITAKHHEGFAMFHTYTDGYNIYDATPFHRDPLAELAAACKKHGMKLGFYYSESQDWHHPGGTALHGGHWDPAQDGSMDEYLKTIAVPQVRELLTNYGDVAVIWWDTPAEMTHERAAEFLPLYSLQPPLITNNRLIHGDPKIPGDYETPEQYIPATGFPGRDWETCMTMNGTWGYKSFDNNWKSTQTLVHNLVDIASKGGNYLLNVGPTSEGVFPDASIQRLKQIGDWMKTNGIAIHDTTASLFRHYTWDGRATVRGNTLFIHVFKWPKNGIRIEGLISKIEDAKILGSSETPTINHEADGTVTIAKPAEIAADTGDEAMGGELPTVIALKLDGPPRVDNDRFAVHAADDGSFLLSAQSAGVAGPHARYEAQNDSIGNINRHYSLYWDILPKISSDYRIELTYACSDSHTGSNINVSVGTSTIPLTLKSTGGDETFHTIPIGHFHLDDAMQTLVIEATEVPHAPAMNFKSVHLIPITAPAHE